MFQRARMAVKVYQMYDKSHLFFKHLSIKINLIYFQSAHRQSIAETDEFSSCKRSSSSNSQNSFNSLKQFKAIRNKILAEIDANEKKTIENITKRDTKALKTDNLAEPSFQPHHHHHIHSPHHHHYLHQHNRPHHSNTDCNVRHYDFCDEIIHHRYFHHNPNRQQLTFQNDNKKLENAIEKIEEVPNTIVKSGEKIKDDVFKTDNKRLRRSKSCPKNLFSNYFTSDPSKNSKKVPLDVDRESPLSYDDDKKIQQEIDRIVNGSRKNIHGFIKRHVKCKKSPTLVRFLKSL